jgi:sugar phosphate isomerase/epimerase
MNKLILAPTTLPDAAPLDYIQAAAAAKFDGVGLRLNQSPGLPFHPVVGDAPLIRAMRQALDDTGLEVLDILSFYIQPDMDLEEYSAALELGASLGARYAVTIGDDSDWNRMRDNFGHFCNEAARFGLTAAIECAVMRPLHSLKLATRMIAECGHANAVICLDPLNHVRAGGTAADLKALDPKLFPYTQFTDGVMDPGEPYLDKLGTSAVGPNQRRLPGEGNVPLRELLAALPPGLPLSVEAPLEKNVGKSPRDWAKLVAETSRRFLAV